MRLPEAGCQGYPITTIPTETGSRTEYGVSGPRLHRQQGFVEDRNDAVAILSMRLRHDLSKEWPNEGKRPSYSVRRGGSTVPYLH
jgi:hypothetical protein